MTKKKAVDLKFEVLMQDWRQTKDSISSLGAQLTRFRSWAVAFTGVSIGIAVREESAWWVCFLAIFVNGFLLYFDAMFKAFQDCFIWRDREIGHYLSTEKFSQDIKGGKVGIPVARPFSLDGLCKSSDVSDLSIMNARGMASKIGFHDIWNSESQASVWFIYFLLIVLSFFGMLFAVDLVPFAVIFDEKRL
ncbi:hypothetical protein [Roseivivax sp. THAF197b]|uniref:hypothetical protein n=1 Tax=Roseivivax sp. THAF197b TaxID=2588299 RepID=UPI001267C12D|nr:hypothetical protein [Roseivivax sp. THAF197b]QFS83491.1 hypothetical protein FIV09_11690 [Roseivivax sp. THAF197b]